MKLEKKVELILGKERAKIQAIPEHLRFSCAKDELWQHLTSKYSGVEKGISSKVCGSDGIYRPYRPAPYIPQKEPEKSQPYEEPFWIKEEREKQEARRRAQEEELRREEERRERMYW